jgi:SAM-dependent methyltransferase
MIWLASASTNTLPDQTLEWVRALAPIIGALVAALAVCLTIWKSIRQGRTEAQYDYAAKALDLRLRQLNDFYAPLLLHLEQSRILYKKLLWFLERVGRENPGAKISLDGFRLLDYAHKILNEQAFLDARPLVQSILDIGDQISTIVAKNAGLVEGGITGTMIEYRAHHELLKAAAKQKPSPVNIEGWQDFGYYPRVLNREVAEGYKEVLRHLEVFQEAGDEIVWRLLDRRPDARRKEFRELLDNLAYYEKNADRYAAKFDNFDISGLRARLKDAVLTNLAAAKTPGEPTPRLKLLDAGCGTGRDTAAFIHEGFEVTAFDISPAMLRKCGRRIREMRSSPDSDEATRAKNSSYNELGFDEIRFRNEFDAIWASASLLHIPKERFHSVVQRLVLSLKPQGVMFMSFKYGLGEAEFDSRHYSYFTCRELRSALKKVPHVRTLDTWLTDSLGARRSIPGSWFASGKLVINRFSDSWINVLVRKSYR